MTKMELLNAIVTGAEVTEEMQAKAKEWAETLAKRSSKPTKAQVENEEIKAEILEAMKPDNFYTVTDIMKMVGLESNQKTSALVRQLKEAGLVIRSESKGKAYFKKA